ncbi:TVP38/TMEM64 family protein [Geomonas sp. RF6]|uniref:TVP38/TMEM64 family protein n=1 Tax=Geomonas sp. RF6 TaxID=2897342 RepID=UPI001E55F09D|nr:TVP38/TMEM64 family protein [Geomonas sp. RF6]UFS71073.1 TVP38/TMEM64 family protein [Geomonas sp. RF6]
MATRKIALIAGVLVLVALFWYFDLWRYLTLESLKGNQGRLLHYYQGHRWQTVTVFVLLYVTVTALSLPGAAVLSLGAGAIFGTFSGALYAVLSATTGATLAFLVSRYLLRDAVLHRFGGRLEGINKELEARGGNYLLFLRLVPLFPFFLVNLAAGVTRLPLKIFVLVTLVGIIPGGLVYCNAGASLATVESIGGILSGRVLLSFVLLGLFALAPAIFFRRR